MFNISNEMSWQVRKKRAYQRKTLTEVALEVGVSRRTLRKIEICNDIYVTKTVFLKITNWLMEDSTGGKESKIYAKQA